ncbi:MAG: DALR anticodon-binding domain-containing protein [Dehalococcoidales bacterium]|nr:DALR anticodon-binding domain-containing protein [Dehalococcoidales bacterium]
MRKLIQLPEIIELITATSEPHHLAYFTQELAILFNQFYKDCRVVTEDIPLTKARLKLVQATQIVLAKTLNLMGMQAPETM